MKKYPRHHWTRVVALTLLTCVAAKFVTANAAAQAKKSNILIIFGDDIG